MSTQLSLAIVAYASVIGLGFAMISDLLRCIIACWNAAKPSGPRYATIAWIQQCPNYLPEQSPDLCLLAKSWNMSTRQLDAQLRRLQIPGRSQFTTKLTKAMGLRKAIVSIGG